MFQYISDRTKSIVLGLFKEKDIWIGPLGGILETTRKIFNKNKILVVTYKAIPPPFHSDVFQRYIELMSEDFPFFTLHLTDDITQFRTYFENMLNDKLTGVLICSENIWQRIAQSDWFPFIKDLCECISTVEQFGINVSSFLGNIDILITSGYQGLPAQIKEKSKKFDLSELFFFPFLIAYCKQIGIDKLSLQEFGILVEFMLSFVDCNNFSFPKFDLLHKMITNDRLSVLVRNPLGIRQETLQLLKYQNMIFLTDYLNLKILKFVSKMGGFPENIVLILSKDFSIRWKQFVNLINKELQSTLPWFVSRAYIESYLARGTEPKLSDHKISYRYWSVFPLEPDQVKKFENCVMKLAKTWEMEIKRKELDKLGEKIWKSKTSPVFLGSPFCNASISDQKELLSSVVKEIFLNMTKRWKESIVETDRKRNGLLLLKICEVLSILHILADINTNLTLIRSELNFIDSSLFKAVSEIVNESQGEHVTSCYSTKFRLFLEQFSTLYGYWEEILPAIIDLAEASVVYEDVRPLELDKNGIKLFTNEWAKHLRTDIEKEIQGKRINLKKWNALSKKYASFTQMIISKIKDDSIPFIGLERAWDKALERLSKVHTLFIIIADSMSMVDWYSIKDGLEMDGFVRNEMFAISPIPTETPVGHASIFSSLRPGECGVTGRTFIDKKGNSHELVTSEEEDDTPTKVGKDDKYQPQNLKKILRSASFERKCLVISPFKGTKLTKTLKALVSEKSEFLEDFDYKTDRKFTDTISWISRKLKSLSMKHLKNNIVIVQFPNIDKRGHGGEWDETIYFTKMENEVNRILQDIRSISKREKMQIGVILTSDHGKLLRWEVDKIISSMDKIEKEKSFSVIAEIINKKLTQYRKSHEPVLSAKYVMGWLNEDLTKVRNEIIFTVKDKVGIHLPSAQHIKFFLGNEISDLLGGKGNTNIKYPNLFLVSLYQFRGPGMMQHSGLSLGELVVPHVYLECGIL